jgi:hypothetical protein
MTINKTVNNFITMLYNYILCYRKYYIIEKIFLLNMYIYLTIDIILYHMNIL